MARYKLVISEALDAAFTGIYEEGQRQPVKVLVTGNVKHDYPLTEICTLALHLFARAPKISRARFQQLALTYHEMTSNPTRGTHISTHRDRDEDLDTLGDRYAGDAPDAGGYYVANDRGVNRRLLTSVAVGWYYEDGLPARRQAYIKAVSHA